MKQIIRSLCKAALTALLVAAVAVPSFSQTAKVTVIKADNSSKDKVVTDGTTCKASFLFSEITAISASSVFEVEVSKSNVGRVTVTAPKRTLEHLIVKYDNGTLKLRVENGYSFSSNKPARGKNLRGPVKVTVEAIKLSKIDLSGASSLTLKDSFNEDECFIDLSGASKAKLNNLSARKIKYDVSGASNLIQSGSFTEADIDASGASKVKITGNIVNLTADISGASSVDVDGKGESVNVDASGASHFNGEDFTVNSAKVDLSGASKGRVRVLKSIKGELSGASKLIYSGNPDKVMIERTRGTSLSHQ